jgi:hypothetical protein
VYCRFYDVQSKICSEIRHIGYNGTHIVMLKHNSVILEAIISRQSQILNAICFKAVVKWIQGKISRAEDGYFSMLFKKTNPTYMNEISRDYISERAFY